MNHRWKTQPLGEACYVVGGGTPSKNIHSYYCGDIPWATVRDMREDVIVETEHRVTKEAIRSSSTNIIPAGNVVIATRVGLGKVCLLAHDTAINQDLRGIIPRNGKLNVSFLYHWLRFISPRIVKEGTGATVQGVRLAFVKGLQIPIIALEEQERIVAILDQAFAGIAAAMECCQRNISNAHSLFDCELIERLERLSHARPMIRIADAIKTASGGTPLSSNRAYYEKGTIPWILSGEVSQGDIRKACHFISEHGLQNSSAKLFPIGTVLIAMYGATAGEVGILGIQACTNQAVCGLLPNDSWISKYLYYAMLYHKRSLIEQATGNAQPNISQAKIKEVCIPKIDKTEQLQLVELLNVVSRHSRSLASVYHWKLTALEALKQSLLNQAFSGNL